MFGVSWQSLGQFDKQWGRVDKCLGRVGNGAKCLAPVTHIKHATKFFWAMLGKEKKFHWN
jgi:hypothetical protein